MKIVSRNLADHFHPITKIKVEIRMTMTFHDDAGKEMLVEKIRWSCVRSLRPRSILLKRR